MGSAAMRARLPLALLAALALLLAAAGCDGSAADRDAAPRAATLPGEGRPAVTIGTRTSIEQIVLGQLYKQALEARGYSVRLKQNIGSTEIADAALRSGEIDLYPEYLGVFDRVVAGEDADHLGADAALAAGRTYAASHGFTLLGPTRFENVEAVAVTPRLARAHALRSIGDLHGVRGLRLGAAPELHDAPGGLPGLARAYGITEVDFAPLTDGLQYPALDDGRIDAAIVRTTDGALAEGDYVLLKDPLHLFGVEPVVPVVASRALAAQGADFERTLDAVSARLTTRAMQQLNAQAVLERRPPEDVARDFLRERDLA